MFKLTNLNKKFLPQFKAAVLEHLDFEIASGSDEFLNVRCLATMRDRWVDKEIARRDFERESNMTPAQIVEAGSHIAGIRVDEITTAYLKNNWRVQHLQKIAGRPLLYVPGAGLYFWSRKPCAPSLVCWLSWPAYPQGW